MKYLIKATGLAICFVLMGGFAWYAFEPLSVCGKIRKENKRAPVDVAIYTVYKSGMDRMTESDKVAFFLDVFRSFELHEGAFTSVMTMIDDDKDRVFIRNALLSQIKKTKRHKTNRNSIIAWLSTSNQVDFINAIQTLNRNNE